MQTAEPDDLAIIARLREARDRVKQEISKVVVGQNEIIESLLIGLLCRGHILLLGVPGLGKTLMARTLARTLEMEFRRVQFTPDLMPADITGTDVMEEDQTTGKHRVTFMQGPVFTNFLLADEINRTPPKTQAALLQAMQEGEVSVGRETYRLKPPFFVVATQNPIEMEGTYPLPEAQLDRFMFNLKVQYPTVDEEVQIIKGTTSKLTAQADRVLSADEVLAAAGPGARRADRRRAWSATRPGWSPPRAPAPRPLPPAREVAGRHPQVPGLRRQPAGVAVPGAGRQGAGDSRLASITSILPTSRPWPRPCCGIAWCSTSTLGPTTSTPTRWSSGCSGGARGGAAVTFDPRQLVDPVFFSRLDNLELRARGIVEGFMHGLHRSPFVGFSVEFASHREYAPGRRPAARELEAVRPAEAAVRQAVRRRDEHEPLPAAGRQRVDELPQHGRQQARIRLRTGRRAGASGAEAARRRRPGALCRRSAGPLAAAGPAAPVARDPASHQQRQAAAQSPTPRGHSRRRPSCASIAALWSCSATCSTTWTRSSTAWSGCDFAATK